MSISSVTKTGTESVVGAVVTNISAYITDKVHQVTGWHLGESLNKIIPDKMQQSIRVITDCLQYPVYRVDRAIKGLFIGYPKDMMDSQEALNERLVEIVQFVNQNIVASILEELIYRGFIQGGGTFALEQIHLSPVTAKIISCCFASLLFGMAHNPRMRQMGFTNPMVIGIILGTIKEICGLKVAITTHILHNILLSAFNRMRS